MNLFLLILIAALVVFVAKGVIIVQQAEVVIVERLGKYDRTLESGLNYIIPIIESPRAIAWKVTQRAIDGVNYNMAKNTCDIVTAINASNQRVIDYMTSEKIDTLNRKLAVAEGQLSNYAQTNAIVSALKPSPTPAYVVPNPYCCYNTSCTGIQ